MTSTTPNTLVTAAEIARKLGEPEHRVRYAIVRLEVEPVHVAGRTRLFDVAVADQVREVLDEFDAKQSI